MTDNLRGFARIIGATFELTLRTFLPDKMARPRQTLFSPDMRVLIGHFAMMRQNIRQFAILCGTKQKAWFLMESQLTEKCAICYWQKSASNQVHTRLW
ncbi:MAG TPA: hypothetical protein VII61_00790 [Ktedonobacteraceae bacterium]